MYKKKSVDQRLQQSLFDAIMDSQKQLTILMEATLSFIAVLIEKQFDVYEEKKNNLISSLTAVQENRTLKQIEEVQELVKDIYENMDNLNTMIHIIPRFGTLLNTPQLTDFNFIF